MDINRPLARRAILLLGLLTLVLTVSRVVAGNVQDKLQRVVVPEVDMADLPFEEVIRYLRDESRRLDPDHEGVNFVFQPGRDGSAGFKQRKITLTVSKMTLADVIHYACMAAGAQYVVEESAVIVDDRNTPLARMETRDYRIRACVTVANTTRKT